MTSGKTSTLLRFGSAAFSLSLAISLGIGFAPASASQDTIGLYMSAPFVQGSHISGANTLKENFNGMNVADPCPASTAIGTLAVTGNDCDVSNAGDYGGATRDDSTADVGGAGSIYMSNVSSTLTFTFTNPVKYLGFWWSAGNGANTVRFLDASDQVLAEMSATDILTAVGTAPLNNAAYTAMPADTLTAVDGTTTYRKTYYYGNPRGHASTTPTARSSITNSEPFAYINLFLTGNLAAKKIEFSGSGFEFDNLAVSTVTETVLSSMVKIRELTILNARPAPRSVPYEGPLNLRNQSGTLCSNGEGVLTGERLNTITEIYVGDKKVAQELLPDGRLKYSLKDIAPGTYQIRYWVPINNVNLTDQIRVGTCSTAPVATTPGAFEASRLFTNYRGDRGPVIARDRAAITAFINQYKGITNVRCVGSTSGVPAKRTDPALAQARAKNACDVVKRLVPNATISLETSTGKGTGQRFRSVTIFISGTN